MGLNAYREMDRNILYSIVNMHLRNDYRDLDALCRCEGIARGELERRLAEAGFEYNETTVQFSELRITNRRLDPYGRAFYAFNTSNRHRVMTQTSTQTRLGYQQPVPKS